MDFFRILLHKAALMSDIHYRRRAPKKRRAEIAALYGINCFYCGEVTLEGAETEDPLRRTVEHLLPLSQGGTDNIKNCRIACSSCNWERNDTDLLEYMRIKGKTVDYKADKELAWVLSDIWKSMEGNAA